MKKLRTKLVLAAGLVVGLLSPLAVASAQTENAQQPASQAPNQAAAPTNSNQAQHLAPGSVIPVQLAKTVDAKKAKVGDEVVAKITQDLKRQDGQVLFPKDTQVLGHITEAQARTKEEKESQVGIAFDRAVMKDGGNVTLPLSIQAVIGPQNPEGGGGGNGASESPSPSTAPSASGMPSGGSRGGMGGGSNSAPPPPSTPSSETEPGAGAPTSSARPPITAKTEGVIGYKDMRLTAAADTKQGSVLTSDKNNVKLESGTLMLLRVVQ